VRRALGGCWIACLALACADGDKTDSCADLTELRVCWDAARKSCSEGICVSPLPVPNRAPSALGWRCTGGGRGRTCVDRRRGVGAFTREGALWVQRHPRMPDDGEWSCSEMGGAVVCAGGDAPAGVPINVADAAWFCGPRRGAGGARVCVDLAPDFPDGVARSWRCGYASDRGGARTCERDPHAHQVGDACSSSAPCLDGVRCVEGRCVPDRPEPSCAFDRDCESGVCRLGSCREIAR
jgi:hypothetical protein